MPADRGKQDKPQEPPAQRPSPWRNILPALVFLMILAMVITLFNPQRRAEVELSLSQFQDELERDNVASVLVREKEIRGELKKPSTIEDTPDAFLRFKTYIPFEDPELIRDIVAHGVELNAKPSFNWGTAVWTILPIVAVLAFWMLIMRQMQAGPNRAFSFGKSRAKLLVGNKPHVTFRDVAGVEEAKQELQEVIEFLKSPQKFQRLGGKIPKGVLLLGPPGTGKTLLARAVAGEAGVPFFSVSGSDFVEMFVGVGASRVRDLFEQGKRSAPCIVFIDEIDAVGRHRGAGLGGGHDEREQTLNALLVEMDGFESNEGVILMAATNRPDVLDPALLRPGRFDRRVVVDRPDVRGRHGILKVHTRQSPIANDVDLEILARATPGFSGADLANMVNEAALLAARYNRDQVTMRDFEEAKDKLLMGVERRSLIINEKEKRSTAYHEAGHVLVSKMIPGADPIHKVTIIPRGMTLGVTQQLPVDDRRNLSAMYCRNQITVSLGGRAAEIEVLHDLSTGSGGDIENATELARKMVCEWGMSERLGPLTFGSKEREIFLGREIVQHRDYSDRTAELIDEEVRNIVEEAQELALRIIRENRDKLEALASALLEKEILDANEIDMIMRGEKLPPRPKPTETQGVEARDHG